MKTVLENVCLHPPSLFGHLNVCFSRSLSKISMNLPKPRYVIFSILSFQFTDLYSLQLLYFSSAAEALSSVQGEIEELSVAAEGEYR
jgi:hypothetical protein